MPGPQIEQLLWLLDLAFDGDREASLIANLRNVDDAAWTATPEGGSRTIAEIAEHAGLAPWVYGDFAFGEGAQSWDEAEAAVAAASRTMAETVEWMREGHASFMAGVAALDDRDLDQLRPAHWGEQHSLRLLASLPARHDIYHAGEINHARSLIQGTDRWGFYA